MTNWLVEGVGARGIPWYPYILLKGDLDGYAIFAEAVMTYMFILISWLETRALCGSFGCYLLSEQNWKSWDITHYQPIDWLRLSYDSLSYPGWLIVRWWRNLLFLFIIEWMLKACLWMACKAIQQYISTKNLGIIVHNPSNLCFH